jgi:hypothetical protein
MVRSVSVKELPGDRGPFTDQTSNGWPILIFANHELEIAQPAFGYIYAF